MIGAQAENALKNDDVLLNLNKMIRVKDASMCDPLVELRRTIYKVFNCWHFGGRYDTDVRLN